MKLPLEKIKASEHKSRPSYGGNVPASKNAPMTSLSN
jgi:hypothetical protein